MLILAYRLMAKADTQYMPTLLNLFSATAAEICEGQQYDMEFENRADISENEYIEMIRLKTAVMLGACLKSGAIAGGAGKNDCEFLYRFGVNLGIAFQIKDDLLDVYGDSSIFGKITGGDILCDKKTFLLVNALEKASKTDKDILVSWFGRTDKKEDKINIFKDIYEKLNIRRLADEAIAAYYLRAMEMFEKVDVCEEKKEILKIFAADLMKRES